MILIQNLDTFKELLSTFCQPSVPSKLLFISFILLSYKQTQVFQFLKKIKYLISTLLPLELIPYACLFLFLKFGR